MVVAELRAQAVLLKPVQEEPALFPPHALHLDRGPDARARIVHRAVQRSHPRASVGPDERRQVAHVLRVHPAPDPRAFEQRLLGGREGGERRGRVGKRCLAVERELLSALNQLRVAVHAVDAFHRRLDGLACPHDYCWHSWKNATQMPAMIVRLTLGRLDPAPDAAAPAEWSQVAQEHRDGQGHGVVLDVLLAATVCVRPDTVAR